MEISKELFEEAKSVMQEAMDLLRQLKTLAIEAKPMVESELEMELSIVRMHVLPEDLASEFRSAETRSEKWLVKFKELFPNEA